MLVVLSATVVYAQTSDASLPSIDQIVGMIMSAVGTWLVAYVVNLLRVKFNIIPGSIFVTLLVPVIGLGVSYLSTLLAQAGNSWFVSFLATLGSVWLSQVIAQLNLKTGPTQYLVPGIPAPTPNPK
jgi:ACR3 family arsenite efflux pump ArsB